MASTSPSLPWKTRFLLAAVDAIIAVARRRDGTVNRRLISLFDFRAPPNPDHVAGVATSDHTVDSARGLWVRLFSPRPPAGKAHPRPLPVIVYFHGGGFTFHSVATRAFDALCRRIAAAVPAVVVSVEYRLAPEHRFPAAYDDGSDVLRWVDGAVDILPDVSAVFLAGDSAGGNIAHHVTRRAVARPFERVVIAGAALLQPFFGGEERTESETRFGGAPPLPNELSDWMWRSFLPEGADRDHEAANVFGPRSGVEWLAGFPATAVFVGAFDPLRDRQLGYVEGLRAAGVEVRLVEYPGAIHGFYAFTELPGAEQVITDMRDFVWERLGKGDEGSTT